MKHLKNCSATSEKRLLQQPKKSTVATFHIICCNIKNESLQNNDKIWLTETLATTKPLDPEGEKEEEVQKEEVDLDTVGERKRERDLRSRSLSTYLVGATPSSLSLDA